MSSIFQFWNCRLENLLLRATPSPQAAFACQFHSVLSRELSGCRGTRSLDRRTFVDTCTRHHPSFEHGQRASEPEVQSELKIHPHKFGT